MNDTLRLAEIALPVVLGLTLLALVCNVVVVAGRRPDAARRSGSEKRVAVGVGASGDSRDRRSSEASAAGAAALAAPRGLRLASYATAFTLVATVLLTVYIAVRWAETGHGPFSNQHEFAVSFVWGILVSYLVAEWRLGVRALAIGALPVAAGLTLYAMQLDAGVQPLVPALQNSLLLTLHVGFAVVAYGAACVSFAAAVLYLVHPRLRLRSLPGRQTFDEVGYKAAVVTFPTLTVMIVLGAVWADTAWGRYWGWDPKETAALVTWLIYGAYLHARVSRGWQGKRSAWLLILGFAAVLFAYFGNHFFGGLHSYG
ncbi:MAG: c-type cytochrome biogenesis protein CcsB [Micrococcales bacterium]|nr:c-type cytochrome biogenesis protein CcsB [Micrococcales bacterium]